MLGKVENRFESLTGVPNERPAVAGLLGWLRDGTVPTYPPEATEPLFFDMQTYRPHFPLRAAWMASLSSE